jgi:hypothetical protein
MPDQKVVFYLSTDSSSMSREAQTRFKDRIIVSGLDSAATGTAVEQVYAAVVEEAILAKTDYRIITRDSALGKLAAFLSGQRSTTIVLDAFPASGLFPLPFS